MTAPVRRRRYSGRRQAGFLSRRFDDDLSATRFQTFTIPASVLAGADSWNERTLAIGCARSLAATEQLTVVDVVRADYQDDGAWLVELRIAP